MARYVGKRIVPKHCGYWDNTKSYEMENIVYDRTSGNSYISCACRDGHLSRRILGAVFRF